MTTTRRQPTVFDLTPKDLQELHKLNLNVSASVPPRKPLRSDGYTSHNEYEFDYGNYERYREMHERAKAQRAEWLRAHHLTTKIAAQAVKTDYNPYAHADRLGLVAPPMPEGYAEALKAWREPKPKPALQQIDISPSLKVKVMSF